jgi:cysteine desulfurase/selenocysteine lyase
MVYSAREGLAGLFNISDPLRVAFTKNATEALNIAIWGLLKPGDHVVTSSMEHNSVMRPMEAARASEISYSVAQCERDGSLEAASVEKKIRPETALVVLTHASNVTGTIMPVADVAVLAHKRGIPILVDAAQTACRLEIDVEAQGIDILAFTGHKELFGPQGTGGLFLREGLSVKPIMYGGTGSHSTSLEQPEEMPDALESGTLNAAGIAGLAAGVRFVSTEGIDIIREHEVKLTEQLLEGLELIPGITVYGPLDAGHRLGIVPMTFDSFSPADVSLRLDERYRIACRAGFHCAPAAHRTMGTIESGTLRVSLSYLNTSQEVDYLLDCLSEITRSSQAES